MMVEYEGSGKLEPRLMRSVLRVEVATLSPNKSATAIK